MNTSYIPYTLSFNFNLDTILSQNGLLYSPEYLTFVISKVKAPVGHALSHAPQEIHLSLLIVRTISESQDISFSSEDQVIAPLGHDSAQFLHPPAHNSVLIDTDPSVYTLAFFPESNVFNSYSNFGRACFSTNWSLSRGIGSPLMDNVNASNGHKYAQVPQYTHADGSLTFGIKKCLTFLIICLLENRIGSLSFFFDIASLGQALEQTPQPTHASLSRINSNFSVKN